MHDLLRRFLVQHLYGRWCLVCALALFSVAGHTSWTATLGPNEAAISSWQSAQVAACNAYSWPAGKPPGACVFQRSEQGPPNNRSVLNITNWASNNIAYVASCGSNATVSGGTTCTCNTGFTQSNNMCISNALADVAALNDLDDPRVWIEGGTPGLTFCKNGQLISGTFSAATHDGKQSIVYGPFTSTGQTCTGTDGSRQIDASVGCKTGTFPGVVNGVSVCVPSNNVNTVAAGPTTAASGASSSTAPGAPAGTAKSETSTACNGANCTTTTVHTDSGGVVIGQNSTTEPKGSYCAENPNDKQCVDLKYDVPEGEVPTREFNIGFETVNLGFGAGSCPPPQTFSVIGNTFELKLDGFCNALTTWVKPVVVTTALFMAFMIAWPRLGE